MPNETTEQIEATKDTLDQPTLADVMKAISDLSGKFDAHKKETDLQFEAIRQGLVQNSAAFDRLEAVVYNSRSDVASLRADVKELSEEVRRNSIKNLV